MPSCLPTRAAWASPPLPRATELRLGALWLLSLTACPGVLQAHDPESEARQALASLASGGTRFEVDGQAATFATLTVSEVEVIPAAAPSVIFHVVGTGRYGPAALGYYGSEHVTLERTAAGLAPAKGWLPKLSAVLTALHAQEVALARKDLPALRALAQPGYRDGALTLDRFRDLLAALPTPAPPVLVSVRIEGGAAIVTEQLRGSPLGRSATLVNAGDFWRFSSGLL